MTVAGAPAARLHSVLLFAIVAGGYAAGSQLAFSWFGADGTNASFFPAAGVLLAALVSTPRRRWPIVLLAAGIAELTLDLLHDIEIAPTLGYVGANLGQGLLGASLLLAIAGQRPDLERTRDLQAFMLAAVIVAPAFGGILGASTFVFLDGGDGWGRFAAEWWVGDGLGVLVVAGAILALGSRPERDRGAGALLVESALGLGAVLATIAVFRLDGFEFVYVPILLLGVVAFRVGTRGVAFTGAGIAFAAAEATARGHRYWDALDITPGTALLYLQLGLGVLIATALALAAEVAERERAAAELSRAEAEREAALERARLYDAERSARRRSELIQRNATRLAVTATATDVAQVTITAFEEAGVPFSIVDRLDDEMVRALASSGLGDEVAARFAYYPLTDETPPAEALREGRVVTITDGEDSDGRYPHLADVRRQVGAQSLISIPLRAADEQVIGVVTAIGAAPRSFEDEDRRSAMVAIADQAGLALERALLYEQERDASHVLQLGLLGEPPRSYPRTSIASAYRPGNKELEVGGDWYDSFPLPRGRVAVLVGDVVGHGLEAAVAMGQLRGAVRALAPLGSPREVLERLDVFVATLPAASMATIAYAELDLAGGSLSYACAGHPPPLVLPGAGAPRLLWEGRSPPLGSSFGVARREARDELEPGDLLLLFTDGLVERRDATIAEGLERLRGCVASAEDRGPQALIDAVLAELIGDDGNEDDVCVLALRLVEQRDPLRITVPADPTQVVRVRRELSDWLEQVDLDAGRRADAVLAVSEAVANAVEHAYGFDADCRVEVEARIAGDEVLLEVHDSGRWREPRESHERGRGRRIMETLMERVTVEGGSDGTIVRMALTLGETAT